MPVSPIFIGGLMKSGTSLLRKLLSRHPNIFGGLETHWFGPEIYTCWQDSTSTRQVWLREFFDVSADEFEAIKRDANSGVDFFTRFMWFCTRRAGKQRWIEKTPDNILHLKLIWEHWPEAKAIHVIRDYRDTYASWKYHKKRSLPEFFNSVHSVMEAAGNLAGKQTASYLEVRYEDLVTDTARVLKKVLGFVDEPWVEGLDQYEGDATDFEKVSRVTGKESPTTIALSRPIFTSSVGQWRSMLTDEEVTMIKQELGGHAAIWGEMDDR